MNYDTYDTYYISLLVIPCIIYYVTNKETLNLDIAWFVGLQSAFAIGPRPSVLLIGALLVHTECDCCIHTTANKL